ncbi:MAG TPA: hypothetical protein PLH46_00905 [Caldisericia bacterium]|nr:hypothetical protein [Caldisericia bacterium]
MKFNNYLETSLESFKSFPEHVIRKEVISYFARVINESLFKNKRDILIDTTLGTGSFNFIFRIGDREEKGCLYTILDNADRTFAKASDAEIITDKIKKSMVTFLNELFTRHFKEIMTETRKGDKIRWEIDFEIISGEEKDGQDKDSKKKQSKG